MRESAARSGKKAREQTMVTSGEGRGEGIVREFGIDMYTLQIHILLGT